MMLKDEILHALSANHNVAQFVSFGPGTSPMPRYSALKGLRIHPEDGLSLDALTAAVMDESADSSVNIRCFRADTPNGNPFHYGITDPNVAADLVRARASEGFYTIVNETIDVLDGGISGVAEGGIVEFAPGDTPRGVEGGDSARMPITLAASLLEIVYGFEVELPDTAERVEFSIHPLRVGVRHSHQIVWEATPSSSGPLAADVTWPNKFSRLLGDKVFGLLVAAGVGASVPRTRVFSRSVAPFEFGSPTRTGETWIRTAPVDRTPGKYSTQRGWRDPFVLLHEEDPTGKHIASVLAQDGVDARYSGAAMAREGSVHPIVEGVAGYGDEFMLGQLGPECIPATIVCDVEDAFRSLTEALGTVSCEWVHDGASVWIVQVHRAHEAASEGVVVSGEPKSGWLVFEEGQTLEDLKRLVDEAHVLQKGILLKARVGLTSHVGDVLRRAKIPARMGQPEALVIG